MLNEKDLNEILSFLRRKLEPVTGEKTSGTPEEKPGEKQTTKKTYREELIEDYWTHLKTPTQMMYERGFGSPREMTDELKKNNIPLRPIDTSKQIIEIGKQYGVDTALANSTLTSDEDEVISESLDIKDYSYFQLFASLNTHGDPDLSYVKVVAQYAFQKEANRWFDYIDGNFAALYITEDNMPLHFSIGGVCLADFLRVKFVSYTGSTLDSSNYFIVQELRIAFT